MASEVPESAPALPVSMPRRPGKPRGYPKPPGSGRKPGVRNKTTAEIRSIAQKHGGKAIRGLVRMAFDPKCGEATRLKALLGVIAYGYGHPVTPSEISGPDGAPLQLGETPDLEVARRLAFLLRSGAESTRKPSEAPPSASEASAATQQPPRA